MNSTAIQLSKKWFRFSKSQITLFKIEDLIQRSNNATGFAVLHGQTDKHMASGTMLEREEIQSMIQDHAG
jgi:hypothetical protein